MVADLPDKVILSQDKTWIDLQNPQGLFVKLTRPYVGNPSAKHHSRSTMKREENSALDTTNPEVAAVLGDRDILDLVGLVSEAAITPGDLSHKKRRLMGGLCQLIEADCWAWTLLSPLGPGESFPPAGFMHGGFSEERLAAFIEAIEHPDMGRYNNLFLEQVFARRRHLTRLRQQLDPEDTFSRSEVFPLWQKADISPLMLSCHPFPDGCLSFVSIYRNEKSPPFSARESRMAHIVLSEVKWMHAQSWPQAKAVQGHLLSPRLRTTLNYLLEGLGRKQIASHLGISENTVSGYIKEVYRFYEVQSHAQLIKYFRDGDGGDR